MTAPPASQRRDRRWHRGLVPLCGSGVVLALYACALTSHQQPVAAMPGDIDHLYLRTAQILQKPDRDQAASLRGLTLALDNFDDTALDPCLQQKRRQLMPIVIALGVISGLHDATEKKELREQALQHLVSLGSPAATAMTGDICFGRGFPPILVGQP